MLRRISALLAALLVLGGGCGDDDEVTGDVVVVGDSVTEQSADAIRAALGGDAGVIGLSGLRTDELVPVAEDAFAGDDRPRVAVVMAGYNDLWQGRDEEAAVEELLAPMTEVDCAVWILVPTVGPWDRARAEALDARVQAAAEEAGVAVETAWRDAVDQGEGSEPLVVGDGVHPTDAGAARVAEVVAAAVDRECD